MPGHGVGKQGFEQGCSFGVPDPPADDAAVEDVEDDVEIKTGPFHGSYQRGPHQLGVRRFKLSPGPFAPAKPGRGSLPGPDLIGGFGQQFGLLINRMAALAAAFGDLTMGGEDAIHRADPT